MVQAELWTIAVEERPLPARYSAELVARWFAAWAEAEDAEVSNLKLQKLLYDAQGHHLAERGAPQTSTETGGPTSRPLFRC